MKNKDKEKYLDLQELEAHFTVILRQLLFSRLQLRILFRVID